MSDTKSIQIDLYNMNKMVANPFHLNLNAFLHGPLSTKPPAIEFRFGEPFYRFVISYDDLIPKKDTLSRFYPNRKISSIDPSLTYVHMSYGTVLYDQDWTPIGGYLESSLSLDETYQGRGLGRELIIQTVLDRGYNPAWDMDNAVYSPAGYAAHKSAWIHAQTNNC